LDEFVDLLLEDGHVMDLLLLVGVSKKSGVMVSEESIISVLKKLKGFLGLRELLRKESVSE
jgi:hypothetical protein